MRFSKRFVSLLALALTDFVSARVCDLTNSSIFNRFLSLPEMDQFEQMLACELDRLLDLKGAGIFMAWKMDLRRDSMIKTICKMDIVETHELHTVLENMLKASHFIPRPLIRPQKDVLCLIARIISSGPSEHAYEETKIVLQQLWRNYLVEYFAQQYTYTGSFFLSNERDKRSELDLIMERLAQRCDFSLSEETYRRMKHKFYLKHVDWNNMSSKEVGLVCKFARGLIAGPPHEDWPLGGYILNEQYARKSRFRTSRPPSLSVQICYDQLKHDDPKWFNQNLYLPGITPFIAEYHLQMNQKELTGYCGYVKEYTPSMTESRMIGLALKSIGRQSTVLLNIFIRFTNSSMDKTAESRFYDFIESASNTFDVSEVLDIWEGSSPFNFDISNTLDHTDICGGYFAGPTPSSEDIRTWKSIKRMAFHYPNLEPVEQREFCSIVERLRSGDRDVDKVLRTFSTLIVINRNTPQIRAECKIRVTIPFPPAINLGVLDGLVAEAELQPLTRGRGCSVIREWNGGITRTGVDPIVLLEAAVLAPPASATRGTTSHSTKSKLASLLNVY